MGRNHDVNNVLLVSRHYNLHHSYGSIKTLFDKERVMKLNLSRLQEYEDVAVHIPSKEAAECFLSHMRESYPERVGVWSCAHFSKSEVSHGGVCYAPNINDPPSWCMTHGSRELYARDGYTILEFEDLYDFPELDTPIGNMDLSFLLG